MTIQIDIGQAKARLSELIERALHGEEVILARAGEPVARLQPIETRQSTRDAMREIERFKSELLARQGPVTSGELRSMIEEGRRH